MKKVLFMFLGLTMFVSCSSSDNDVKKVDISEVKTLVEKKYGVKIEQISSLNEKKNTLSNKALSNKIDNKLEDEGFIFIKNGEKISAKIFKDNKNKYLISNDKDFEITLENNVDKNGNGSVTITSNNQITEKKFLNGKLIDIVKRNSTINKVQSANFSVKAAKNPYRQCFDQAYDDICDGLVGCLSWYSSPLPALTSAVYCGFVS